MFAIVVACLWSAPAAADFRLCNNTSSRVGIALGYKDAEGWVTEGWWNVSSRACETLLRYDNGAVVYGNVDTASLRAMFAGERAAELRRRLVEGTTRPGEPCHGCAHRADRYAVPPLDEIPVEPLHW